jgi:2-keto-4-pentenoate hydratase/2-oxohepta-3-ene-1,7-dioic acid hydratase in catechol pathway
MRIARVLLPAPGVPLDGRPPTELRLVAGTADPQLAIDLQETARLDLIAGGATPQRSAELARAAFPPSLTAVLSGGARSIEWMKRLADGPAAATACLAGAQFVSPVDPLVYRDFSAFDEHVVNTWGRANRDPPSVTRQLPIFFKGSTATLIGHDAVVPWPHYVEWMDYELEVGVVIGAGVQDIEPGEALDAVFGLTMLNDLSGRDMQFREMSGRLGPAKGKDFATAVGPWVVTLDELDLDNIELKARVNGEQWSLGNLGAALWSVAEIVAWGAAGEPLLPGDLLGTGTVGGGSGLEFERGLDAGDVLELEGAGIGILRNVVGERARTGYMPVAKKVASR